MAVTTTFAWGGDELLRDVEAAAKRGLVSAAGEYGKVIQDNLRSNPSPSAPGTFPGKDTGYLANNVTFVRPYRSGPMRVSTKIGSKAHYGRYLETGVGAFIGKAEKKDGTFVTYPHPGFAARPWLRPSIIEGADRARVAFAQGAAKELARRAGRAGR